MSESLEQIESSVLSDIERKHYEQIKELERKCDELESAYETDKAAASSSKKRWEEAVSNLRSLIRRGPDGQQELPFREDWRDVPIRDAITLSAKQLELLESNGIISVDDFENLRAGNHRKFPHGLIDLPRVGQATIDKWEDEIVEWLWKAQQETQPEPAAVGDDDDE